jgi:hydrophobic/amphiphilic exporter-1 (mainly G- bacteria), HAE1 family
VAAPITASTLTTLAVFLPLIFLQGMAGIMFKQLAYVISFALVSSLVVALTLIPMLASRFMVLPPAGGASAGTRSIFYRLYASVGAFLEGLEDDYKSCCNSPCPIARPSFCFRFCCWGSVCF